MNSNPSQFNPSNRQPLSVSGLTMSLKETIEGRFSHVSVEGEVLSVRRASRGHLYFTLKDAQAQIPCVVWQRMAQSLPMTLQDGMQVIIYGDVQVYPPHGRYQLVARRIVEAGLGQLLHELEKLRRKLDAEGLFHPDRKKKLPLLPRAIGVATSINGAAVTDILKTLRSRYPCRVIIKSCQVQGKGAAEDISDAVRALDAMDDVDVIICGRGGGSLQDLWAFNEEILVRTIADARTPVISAVGHEVDMLLTDAVADKRAPTPTAAAEMAIPRMQDLVAGLGQIQTRIGRSFQSTVAHARHRLALLEGRLPDPTRLIADPQQRLDGSQMALEQRMRQHMIQNRHRLAELTARLRNLHPKEQIRSAQARLIGLNHRLRQDMKQQLENKRTQLTRYTQAVTLLGPTASLERGYAIVRTDDGHVARCASDATVGQRVEIILHRGAIDATVVRTREIQFFESEEA
jgi:exodeoxyribonuclease VII large subunit